MKMTKLPQMVDAHHAQRAFVANDTVEREDLFNISLYSPRRRLSRSCVQLIDHHRSVVVSVSHSRFLVFRGAERES